ncbi:MAG: histidine phosphatase family protein [Armatimonadota bacterium]
MIDMLIIRHGETAWNREEVFRGRADVPLSDRGREQARLLAQALGDADIEAVYSSPLTRATETAAPLAEPLGLEVIADERLTDMSFGAWEGRARAELEQAEPELYRLWHEDPARFRAPGGESLGEVLSRAWPAFEEIAQRHSAGRVAVVSHRVVCKLLLCTAIGVGAGGFWRVRVDTASVSAVERGADGWVVTRANDRHHLRGMSHGLTVDF